MPPVQVKRHGPSKAFELTIPFTEFDGDWYPLLEVSFMTIHNEWLTVPLIFDTGAEPIILKPDYEHLFSLTGEAMIGPIGQSTGHTCPSAEVEVELFGHTQSCEVVIDKVPKRFAAGIFGRDGFKPYGFGFWEGKRELYVTLIP
jgi:hypothetical protein